ncbi:hypothetical protein [Shewanella sp. Actino-trap-3]|nr:hypothetical protein [Shewanella sp. Actino-trap-3]
MFSTLQDLGYFTFAKPVEVIVNTDDLEYAYPKPYAGSLSAI